MNEKELSKNELLEWLHNFYNQWDFWSGPSVLHEEAKEAYVQLKQIVEAHFQQEKAEVGDVEIDLLDKIIDAVLEPFEDYDVNEEARLYMQADQYREGIHADLKKLLSQAQLSEVRQPNADKKVTKEWVEENKKDLFMALWTRIAPNENLRGFLSRLGIEVKDE